MRKRQIIAVALGLALLVAALALTAYNLFDDARASMSAEVALRQLTIDLPSTPQSSAPTLPSGEGIDDESIPDYVLNPQMDMPVCEIDGADYVAILEIPDLGLTLPIGAESTDAALRVSPARYAGSAYLDNLVIAGHNYTAHFAKLYSLQQGARVTLTDMDGNVFNYEVFDQERLSPDDIENMTTGDWDLTLFTCTVGRQYRIAVRCIKV